MRALLALPDLPADVVAAAQRRARGQATAGDLRVLADVIEARRIGG